MRIRVHTAQEKTLITISGWVGLPGESGWLILKLSINIFKGFGFCLSDSFKLVLGFHWNPRLYSPLCSQEYPFYFIHFIWLTPLPNILSMSEVAKSAFISRGCFCSRFKTCFSIMAPVTFELRLAFNSFIQFYNYRFPQEVKPELFHSWN